MKIDSFVSVIVASENNPFDYAKLKELAENLSETYADYEILIVNSGPFIAANKKFDNEISHLLSNVPAIRYIQMGNSSSLDQLFSIGLENAIGDFIILFNINHDPISAIDELVKLSKSGYDVVVGTTKPSNTVAYSVISSLARRILHKIDYYLPKNSTTLRCLSRRAVNSVTSTGKFYHQLFMRIQKTGYPFTTYSYERTGEVKNKDIFIGFNEFIKLLVFNSFRPLRCMSVLGFIGSVCSFAFAIYSLVSHMVRGHVVEGWTTTILFMSFLFMVQFIMLAFFGEYIARLLRERNNTADYAVVFEKNSSIMLDADRVNVLEQSFNDKKNLVQTGRDR